MNRFRCVLVCALVAPLCGCGVTFDVGHEPLPRPDSRPERHPDRPRPDRPGGDRYSHLPRRMSFSPMSDVTLKEGCYMGDFVLGRSQIEVRGAGIGKTVIHGNLVLQTQCEVSCLTVLGDVIFEGNQAELIDADFFGQIIDKGVQNSY